VLSLAHRLDRGQRRGGCQQRHARVSEPAGLEAGQLVGQLQRQLGGSHHGVDVHGPAHVLPVQSRSRVVRQQLGEAFDPERVDRQARGGAMAAELLQLPGARAQPGVQVVCGDAAPRALGTLVADRDQHHRPAVALDQTRRHDPDHALVPVGRRQHVGAALSPDGVASLHLLCGQLEDLFLDRLAAAVQALEFRGQLTGTIIVIGQQQVEGDAGVPQPSGRVDARAEPEAEVARRDARAVDAGGRHQRPQPGLGGARHAAQPSPHQSTVLVEQRHHVGHGGQRHQVEVLVELVAFASAARVQRLCQLQHHAGAAQLRERVVRRPRADQQAVGQLLGRAMVVGHDHVHAELSGSRHLRGCRDAAVDRDDQLHALAGQPLQCLGADAVALLEAAGQVPADLGAQRPQHQNGQRRRADAVGVVVAVHADPLARLHGGQDAVAGAGHVAEQQRVVTRALRLEEGAGGGGIAMAAAQQHLGHGAADTQLPGQIQGGRLRAGIDQPSGSAFIHSSHARKRVGQRRGRRHPASRRYAGPREV
jgi:hypothetical protein